MRKGIANKKYTGEYKQMVVEYMRENGMSCWQAKKEFDLPTRRAQSWERIYLEEGAEGLYAERCGRASAPVECKRDANPSWTSRLKKT